jgi:hypothetical protein
MRTQARCKLYGMELKNSGEYEGRAFSASAVFHLDADMAGSQNKKVYGVVTRPFKGTREQGDRMEHLGQSLPIEVDCVFDIVATPGGQGREPGVRLDLLEIAPVANPVKKAA